MARTVAASFVNAMCLLGRIAAAVARHDDVGALCASSFVRHVIPPTTRSRWNHRHSAVVAYAAVPSPSSSSIRRYFMSYHIPSTTTTTIAPSPWRDDDDDARRRRRRPRVAIRRHASSDDRPCHDAYAYAYDDDDDDEDHDDVASTSTHLGMERIYSEWSIADDLFLHENRRLPLVRLASLLGRGMHGVESRLSKLSDVNGAAYARLFADEGGGGGGGGGRRGGGDGFDRRRRASSTSDDDDSRRGGGGTIDAATAGGGLTPAREVLRRIRWDDALPSSSFSVLHYDRVLDGLVETPFDAPNDTISGRETSLVFALPEHRIECIKYLDRIVWDKKARLDIVFGSMNGNGMTINVVVDTYDEWKKERDDRIERDRMRQTEVMDELRAVLGERGLIVLRDMSSRLLRANRYVGTVDSVGDVVRDYVRRVVGLYRDARGREDSIVEENGDDDEY